MHCSCTAGAGSTGSRRLLHDDSMNHDHKNDTKKALGKHATWNATKSYLQDLDGDGVVNMTDYKLSKNSTDLAVAIFQVLG